MEPYGLDRIPRLEAGDPAGAVEALRRQADTVAGAAAELEQLEGTASSEDGFVTAVVGAEGLRRIDLEPRAMRLASQDLSETIVTLVRAATDDLVARRHELLAELGADLPRPSLAESREKLAELEALSRAGTGDMLAIYEQFRRRLET